MSRTSTHPVLHDWAMLLLESRGYSDTYTSRVGALPSFLMEPARSWTVARAHASTVVAGFARWAVAPSLYSIFLFPDVTFLNF